MESLGATNAAIAAVRLASLIAAYGIAIVLLFRRPARSWTELETERAV